MRRHTALTLLLLALPALAPASNLIFYGDSDHGPSFRMRLRLGGGPADEAIPSRSVDRPVLP